MSPRLGPLRAGVLVALLSLGAFLGWLWLDAPGARAPWSRLPMAALADSQRTAVAAGDWNTALLWSERLAGRQPRDAGALLDLAMAWHNYGWHLPDHALTHDNVPYSLQRLQIDRHAYALIDSAARVARTREEWARATTLKGLWYEVLGMPVDALGNYLEVRVRAPEHEAAIPRGRWVLRVLEDPQSEPDPASEATAEGMGEQ